MWLAYKIIQLDSVSVTGATSPPLATSWTADTTWEMRICEAKHRQSHYNTHSFIGWKTARLLFRKNHLPIHCNLKIPYWGIKMILYKVADHDSFSRASVEVSLPVLPTFPVTTALGTAALIMEPSSLYLGAYPQAPLGRERERERSEQNSVRDHWTAMCSRPLGHCRRWLTNARSPWTTYQ